MGKLTEKLMKIQTELKAPKNLYNSFGKYKYRNAEGICEAVKPFLKEYGCALILSDTICEVGGRIYVKATAELIDYESGADFKVSAYAREPESKKGMDDSQITGTASSYARKYALNGLFLLDDTKDADTDENHVETQNRAKKDVEKQKKNTGAKAKVNIVSDKCKEDDIDAPKLCKLYKKDAIEKMTETELENVLSHWEQVKAMCKRAK